MFSCCFYIFVMVFCLLQCVNYIISVNISCYMGVL